MPRAFTLLELLVVIGIIAILLVAALPAVTSLSKSSGRKGAISSLLGSIEQARSLAIKDGQATYLVLPGQLPPGADSSTIQRYGYRSFAIFEDEDDPVNPGTKKIKQVSSWKTLPTGVGIRSGSLNYLAKTTQFNFTPMGSTVTAPFPFLKFNANGEVDPSSTPSASTGTIQFGIFEGYVDANGTDKSTSKTNFTESIEVSRLTGRAKRM
jgi:prepilin-type N-terminal cleavage/methylation domain-containing protein